MCFVDSRRRCASGRGLKRRSEPINYEHSDEDAEGDQGRQVLAFHKGAANY